ncbi:MAG: hypothetical protein AB7L13_11505 [Acidimicrobiia bacterium]
MRTPGCTSRVGLVLDGAVIGSRGIFRARSGSRRVHAPAGQTIWDDTDVAAIYVVADGHVSLDVDALSPADFELVVAFIEADVDRGMEPLPSNLARACRLAVQLIDELSAEASVGWRKLVVSQVADIVATLWSDFRHAALTEIYGRWVVDMIDGHGWAEVSDALRDQRRRCEQARAEAGQFRAQVATRRSPR